ncbi:MAG: insulinase family protein [Dysgonamonadaceae bacterium]|jgi:predicted Zn-dependent peptidase|nr:insulinase family protein [Dysgonamonadaceae bacterium]
MQYFSFTLINGLRVVFLPSFSHVNYCGFTVDVGTRDERMTEHGLAHFVEHNLFKGTRKRKSRHILNRMEAVGGELNAYTTKEETFLYSVCLAKDTERAIELLSDLVFNSQFPTSEIEKEREVVIDEINSYEDTPSDLIFDEFENLVFEGSEMGHNILGDAKSLETFTPEICHLFSKQFYRPDRMIFFINGNLKEKKVRRLVEKYMADIQSNNIIDIKRNIPKIIPSRNLSLDKDLHQNHIIVGCRICSTYDAQKMAIRVLNNILGGPGMTSRLNIELREKRGLVYTVESNLNFYTDCGIFNVYFGCDHNDREKCLYLTHRELKKLRNNKLTDSQFTSAIKQWKGQLGVVADQHENLALSMGKRFLRFNNYESLEETHRRINLLTAEQLLSAANEFFDENSLFSLTY